MSASLSHRLTYNPRTGSFVSLNTPRPWAPQVHDTHTRAKLWNEEEDLLPCVGCQYQAAGLHASPGVRISTTSGHSAIQINNEIYHKDDTILFSNRASVARGAPSLQIGQIKRWNCSGRNSKVEVTLFKCWDEFFGTNISFPAQEVPLSPPVPRAFTSDPVSNRQLIISTTRIEPRQASLVHIQTKSHYLSFRDRPARHYPQHLQLQRCARTSRASAIQNCPTRRVLCYSSRNLFKTEIP